MEVIFEPVFLRLKGHLVFSTKSKTSKLLRLNYHFLELFVRLSPTGILLGADTPLAFFVRQSPTGILLGVDTFQLSFQAVGVLRLAWKLIQLTPSVRTIMREHESGLQHGFF